jgi:hypothetical protein
MKTIITILIAAFVLGGIGVGDARALGKVSREQLQAEYRQLVIQHTYNASQIEAYQRTLANTKNIYVYSLKGSGNWRYWTASQVADHLRGLYGTGQKTQAWWIYLMGEHVKYAAAMRSQLATLQKAQAEMERRMRNIQAILKQPVDVSVVVPNLKNVTLDQAKASVGGLQLGLRCAFKKMNDPRDHNRIFAQSVAPGTTVRIGTIIGVDVGYCPPRTTPTSKTTWALSSGYPKTNPDRIPVLKKSGKRGVNWSVTGARIDERKAIIHRRHETSKTIVHDWTFNFSIQGDIPRNLKKGDTFTVTLVGRARGMKMAGNIGHGFGVRTSGLDVRAHDGGRSSFLVGRDAGTGKLYTHVTKTITFTVQNDTRRPRLHFVIGKWGTMVSYEWIKAGS